ncbi:MAG: SRPBCC family protein [Gemmatimonadota bacterium]|nr:SRPBCC family protein [Gemmatimonadota bacterium]
MKITRSVTIDTTRERLWFFLTDQEAIKRWNTDIISDEVLTEGPLGVGTRSRIMIREGSREVEYANEIIEYDEPDRLSIRLTGGSLGDGPMTIHYVVSGSNGALDVRFDSDWEAHGVVLKLLSPLLTLMGRRNARRVMSRLKEVAESD